jgi:outer membrane murein-binding lipoprotein Lpp
MGSVATQDVDQAVVDGVWSEDPLVRLLARQVQLSGARMAELEADNAELTSQVARLSERVKRLQGKLDGARREAKRQAAPFSKGTHKTDPKRPGRRPGAG